MSESIDFDTKNKYTKILLDLNKSKFVHKHMDTNLVLWEGESFIRSLRKPSFSNGWNNAFHCITQKQNGITIAFTDNYEFLARRSWEFQIWQRTAPAQCMRCGLDCLSERNCFNALIFAHTNWMEHSGLVCLQRCIVYGCCVCIDCSSESKVARVRFLLAIDAIWCWLLPC